MRFPAETFEEGVRNLLRKKGHLRSNALKRPVASAQPASTSRVVSRVSYTRPPKVIRSSISEVLV